MSVGLRQIHLKTVDFISFVNFEWRSQSEVVSIGIRVLRRTCGKTL